MNSLIQALVLVLITIAIIFSIVLKSPMIALGGLLITFGAVVWFKEPTVRGGHHVSVH